MKKLLKTLLFATILIHASITLINHNKESIATLNIKCPNERCNFEITEKDITTGSMFGNTSYQNLDIFKNHELEVGNTGTSKFRIQNTENKAIVISLTFVAQNNELIDIKYKLKQNKLYLTGSESEYRSVDELDQHQIEIQANSHVEFELDYQVIEGTHSNDSEAKYTLSVNADGMPIT